MVENSSLGQPAHVNHRHLIGYSCCEETIAASGMKAMAELVLSHLTEKTRIWL